LYGFSGGYGTDASVCRVVPDLCAPRTRSGIHLDLFDILADNPGLGCAARAPRKGAKPAPGLTATVDDPCMS
jgi:hypothetical protein